MKGTGTIASRIIQYLGIKGVTQEEFAEDSTNGKPFDKGRLGKAKSKDTIGSDVVEKFLRRFPEVNPYWLILGTGKMHNEKESSYDEPVKVMPLDTWEELKRNNRQFEKSHESDQFDKSKLYDIIAYFTGSAVNPQKA